MREATHQVAELRVPLASRFYRTVGKRLIDIAAGGIGSLVFLMCYLPIALAIRLDSPGPVLFTQERAGLHERPFRMYKFRTMFWSIQAHDHNKPQDSSDQRITRTGRWLRRASLDELPQFLHILQGNMSFVGPRPELPERLSLYRPEQRRRSDVKPGLTGWWQVHGRPQPMQDYVDLDLFYVDNLSFLLDMRIIGRTVRAVFSAKGAI